MCYSKRKVSGTLLPCRMRSIIGNGWRYLGRQAQSQARQCLSPQYQIYCRGCVGMQTPCEAGLPEWGRHFPSRQMASLSSSLPSLQLVWAGYLTVCAFEACVAVRAS